MSLIEISASILGADFTRLGEEVEAVRKAGVGSLHLDVMDGRFVPNLTFGPLVARALQGGDLPMDVHAMVESPEIYIPRFASYGVRYYIVHLEACVHLNRVLQMIKDQGMRPGVALNPATDPSLLQYVLPDVEQVLVMTVNPGFAGQKFIPTMLEKIRQVRDMILDSRRSIRLAVDGGINPDTASMVCQAGADILVAASAIFGADDYEQAVVSLKQ